MAERHGNHANNGDISGLILAGGLARRMNGQDKGLILFRDKSMVKHIAQALSPQCDYLFINANRNIGDYEKLGYPVIPDHINGFQGPLAGMLSGLHHISTQWLITAPCDGPFMTADYVQKMQQAVAENQTQIAIAACHDRQQPVYALIHRALMESLQTFLDSDQRKIDRWYAQHEHTIVDFSTTPQMFKNINTPEQLQALEGA